jgi:predicted nucleotidyltransferase
MSDLTQLARTLGVSDRTLRRAANSGLLHVVRLSERRLQLPAAERRYIEQHWSLLAGLRRALRTEPNVAMAVLFGSVARGDETPGSDVDVLVDLHDPDRFRMLALEERLSSAVGRDVQLLRLADAQREPMLLAEVLDDGRVLADRHQRWRRLVRGSARVRRHAGHEFETRARNAIDGARRSAAS